jgi:molybdate transport system substrate-binding protein
MSAHVAERSPLRRCTIVIALLAALAGCGDDEGVATGPVPGNSGPAGALTVSAAASLTDAFEEIAEDFEAANPGATITLNLDSSGTLAEQILAGAPVDAFASADLATMGRVADGDLVEGDPEIFARNELVIVTEPGNPGGITTLGDLADVGIIALCGEGAPCGASAGQILDDAGVELAESAVTRGQNARSTLGAVAQGDAVAGIVYVTDALTAGESVETVAIPVERNVVAEYPVAALADSLEPDLARAFVDFVLSAPAGTVLADHGFAPPR